MIFGDAAETFGFTPEQVGELTLRQLWKLRRSRQSPIVDMATANIAVRKRERAIDAKLREHGIHTR